MGVTPRLLPRSTDPPLSLSGSDRTVAWSLPPAPFSARPNRCRHFTRAIIIRRKLQDRVQRLQRRSRLAGSAFHYRKVESRFELRRIVAEHFLPKLRGSPRLARLGLEQRQIPRGQSVVGIGLQRFPVLLRGRRFL